jgi:D-arabinose 5-phosphate isomerase GutQ
MLRGQWFRQSELQAMLDALAAKHAAEEDPDGVMLRGRWYSRSELDAMADAQHESKKEEFVEGVLSSDRIFIVSNGREPVASSFAMKLRQLGLEVYFEGSQISFFSQDRKLYVGDATVPAIGEGDLLIAFSRSGHQAPRFYSISSAAKDCGASTFLVASLPQADLQGDLKKDVWNIFDLVLVLPDAVVLHPEPKADFDKVAQLFVDEVVTRIIEKRGHPKPEMAAMLDAQNAEKMRKLVEKLANGVLSSDRIFLAGAGDSEPLARSSAMKLMQAGLQAYMVGDEATPAIAEGDVLIAVSRSGSSRMAGEIAAAKRSGASVFLLTGRSTSRIGNMSDLVFVLGPYSPRDDFDKAAHLFVNEVVTLIMKKSK